MTTLKDIGNRLRSIRKRLELTQSDMAKRIGNISHGSISAYELGDARAPLDIVMKYAEIGNVTYDWIFLGLEPGMNFQELAENEQRLLAAFRKLDLRRQIRMIEDAEEFAQIRRQGRE